MTGADSSGQGISHPGEHAFYCARMEACESCQLPVPVASPITLVRPGEQITVWSGTAHRLDDGQPVAGCSAQLALVWRRSFALELTLHEPSWDWWPDDAERRRVGVGLSAGPSVGTVQVQRINETTGSCNRAVLGDRDMPVVEVRATLTNQPRIFVGDGLHDHATGATWSGHWSTVTDGWNITIDALPTLTDDFRVSEQTESFALTHTLGVARTDGGPFTHAAARNVTYALQTALSFAAGYWVGLICPSGYDHDGNLVWMDVAPTHNGRARRCGAWLNDTRPADFTMLIQKFLPMWHEPEATDPLRSATTSSILSHGSGFLEQRIITALSALDTLSWTAEVLESDKSARKWRNESATQHLTCTLKSLRIDPAHTTAAGREAISNWGREHNRENLPSSVVAVRNAITHPKPSENIYTHNGVLTQAWALAAYWLQLAILRRIKYLGEAADTADFTRFAGTSEPVPWTEDSDDPETDGLELTP